MKPIVKIALVLCVLCALAGLVFVQTVAQKGGKDDESVPVSNVSSSGDSFTDSRDGKTYRIVKIGNQTWMAENLNYQTGNSWCYGNDSSNCSKYGRLYDWNTAMKACPSGWRLPSRQDWDDLGQVVGDTREPDENGTIDWYGAVKKLKSRSGWNNNGNGTDDFGFSALPGSYRSTDGTFDYAGINGYWWSATEGGSGCAWYRYMLYGNGYAGESYNDKGFGFSVRCCRAQN